MMVTVRSGLPAVALEGEIARIETDPTEGAGEGEGCGCDGGGDALLLPQPETVISAASNSTIPDIRNMRTSRVCGSLPGRRANNDTGEKRTTTSDRAGDYVLTSLSPGTYQVTISAPKPALGLWQFGN